MTGPVPPPPALRAPSILWEKVSCWTDRRRQRLFWRFFSDKLFLVFANRKERHSLGQKRKKFFHFCDEKKEKGKVDVVRRRRADTVKQFYVLLGERREIERSSC